MNTLTERVLTTSDLWISLGFFGILFLLAIGLAAVLLKY